MSNPRYMDLLETKLMGSQGLFTTINIGEKITWINPTLERMTIATVVERMINDYGAGPFVLEKITQIPAGSTLFTFTDKNGKKREVAKTYFAKYEHK